MVLRLGIYGGTFNPPHIGHVRAAEAAARQLALDRLVIVPAGIPPHKELPPGSPTGADRLEMARLSFSGIPCAEVSDLEVSRGGVSYTSETVQALSSRYPGAEVFLLMGSDMYACLDGWKDAEQLLKRVFPAVFLRGSGEDGTVRECSKGLYRRFGAKTFFIEADTVEISSTQLRAMLPRREGREYFESGTYAYIIRKRLYGSKPSFDWLREQSYGMMKASRIPHVAGCEKEAVSLASRWGADPDEAREAAILHDITKHLEHAEQLQLCERYGIITDIVERSEVKLLHAKTGAAVARDTFGVSQAVYDAIYWHTTGRAGMSLLEKVIYIADYIEPTRAFEGVDELRRLAYVDLDAAVAKGLEMSLDDMRSRGVVPHRRTEEALDWFKARNAV